MSFSRIARQITNRLAATEYGIHSDLEHVVNIISDWTRSSNEAMKANIEHTRKQMRWDMAAYVAAVLLLAGSAGGAAYSVNRKLDALQAQIATSCTYPTALPKRVFRQLKP